MSAMQTGTGKSANRSQMKRGSIRIKESDEDGLVSHAQSDPRIETSINGDRDREMLSSSPGLHGGIGVTRTVEVSSTVEDGGR